MSAINEIDLGKEVYEDENNKKNNEVEEKENNDMQNLKEIIEINDNFNVEELNSSKDDNDNKDINPNEDNSISEENSENGTNICNLLEDKNHLTGLLDRLLSNNDFDKYKEINLQLKKNKPKKRINVSGESKDKDLIINMAKKQNLKTRIRYPKK